MRSIILCICIVYLSFYCSGNEEGLFKKFIAKPQLVYEEDFKLDNEEDFKLDINDELYQSMNDKYDEFDNKELLTLNRIDSIKDTIRKNYNQLKPFKPINDPTYTDSTNTTEIAYTGPTPYQLDKYNRLMSYSYYPTQPMSRTVPPAYINPDTYFQLINDPFITNYIDVSSYFIVGYHKIVYYVNYVNKEFVVSIVPVNTTQPYKSFTCFYNTTQAISTADHYQCFPKLISTPGSTRDCFFLGNNIDEDVNLKAVIVKIRFIQQKLFEKVYLSGHGPKSDWTFTLISKDTGNNAAMFFLYYYYMNYMSYSYIGGLNRFYINTSSGYKVIQQMGFGNLKDKLVQSTNNVFQYGNYTGKNIFMTISHPNDLLSTARYTFNTSTISFSIPTSASNTRLYFTIDSLHRDIIYDYYGGLENQIYYACNKYKFYVDNTSPTVQTSDLDYCFPSTILREYFGVPNYFYRYSVWYPTGDGRYAYNYNDPASFISYTNTNYDICTASG